MATKTTPKRGPTGHRKRGPLNLTLAEQRLVRRAARKLHAKLGSDAEVAKACIVDGEPLTAATICRVRNDIPAGRKVARGIAAALGVDVVALLDGTVTL